MGSKSNLVTCIHKQQAYLCNCCDIKLSNYKVKQFWCSHRTQFQLCKFCANLPVFPLSRDTGFPPLPEMKKRKGKNPDRAATKSSKSKKNSDAHKPKFLVCEHKVTAHLCPNCAIKAAIDCKCEHKKFPSKCDW